MTSPCQDVGLFFNKRILTPDHFTINISGIKAVHDPKKTSDTGGMRGVKVWSYVESLTDKLVEIDNYGGC